MKNITMQFFAVLVFAFSWQAQAQFSESFETGIPAPWTIINGGGSNAWAHSTSPAGGAFDGTGVAAIEFNSVAHDDYLITPPITVAAGVNDALSFYVKSRSSIFLESYEVLLSTTNTNATSFTTTLQASSLAPNAWTEVALNLSAYVGQTIYVALRATGTDEFALYADLFVNGPLPSCLAPSNLDATVLSGNTTAALSWDDEPGATLGYNWAVMASGENPDLNTPVALGSTAGGVITDTATGLTAGEAYDFYVQSNCDANGLSEWAGPVSFLAFGPPVNDDCATATSLIVESDLNCLNPVAGSTMGATQSLPGCLGNANDDVWYSFTATTSLHTIIINNTSGTPDIVTEVFDACGVVSLVCQDTPNSPVAVNNLTAGNTYYFRIYTWSSSDSTRSSFTVCVGTPPAPPANNDCANAEVITESGDSNCSNTVSGTTQSANTSADYSNACANNYNDVWYAFTPTTTGEYNVTRTLTSGTSSTYLSIWEGSCGALTRINSSCFSTSLSEDLVAGTTYYISVATLNSGATSFDLCVYPSPTCYVPEDLAASFVAPDGVNLSWSAPTDGTTPVGYNWEIVPQGNAQGIGVIDSGSVTVTNASATGLTPETLYDLYVQSDCGAGDLSVYAGPFTFNTGHCLPSGTNTNTYINDFTATGPYTNISNLGSGLSTNNYGDFYNTQAIEVVPGMSFDFSTTIVSGTVGSTIWIDWNNDFVFDQATETMFTTTSFGNGPFTGSITVPAGIADGDYRMRVMIDWNDSNPSEDACALNFGRGEVEDYKVTVNATLSADSFNQIAFNYYPNPVSNVLTIKGQQTIEKVSVYNMLGQTVLNTTPNAATSQVDMSALQAGAYFVKVTIANSTETIRIIKN
ncbi:choice-of-anchor J domain-containing protein [Bizionia sediminis]|uniref:Choice-of-anchor J domain-containing protein n=1 Tax=Bizionia sediminis TaxID=1737064 RepID=A0ABW5KUQ0_9FLAO